MGIQQAMVGAGVSGPAPNPGWAWSTAVNLQALAPAASTSIATLTIAGTSVVGMQGGVSPGGTGAFGPLPAGTDGQYLQVYLETITGSMSGTDFWVSVLISPSWSLSRSSVGVETYTGTMRVRRTTDNTEIGSFSVNMQAAVSP